MTMCGRFALYTPGSLIRKTFNTSNQLEIIPNYNITPSSDLIVVCQIAEEKIMTRMHWGFIPHWVSVEKKAKGMINARIESVRTKPYFRSAFKDKRCLIIANGFYEWQQNENNKQPYYLSRGENNLIAFAGIWDYWHDEKNIQIATCAIITTKAPEKLLSIHDRNPVIIKNKYCDDWFKKEMTELELNNIIDHDDLLFYRVSNAVNNPRNNDKNCIKEGGI